MGLFTYVKTHKDSIILGIVALWLIGCTYVGFYILSYFVTTIGAVVVFVSVIALLIYFLSRLATFPGGYYIWRRTLEKSCCTNIVQITQKNLEVLSFLLECVKENCFETIYDRVSFGTLQSIPKQIERIVKNYEGLEVSISPEQLTILTGFQSIQACLKSLNFTSGQLEQNLYDFLLNPKLYRKALFPSTDSIPQALQTISSIQSILTHALTEKITCKDIINFFTSKEFFLFGSLDYMRTDVITKLEAEQIWITSFDGCKLDCLWIPGSTNNIMIYCNPNGGYYEFTNIQNEWVEFYLSLGFTIMLWNYRGFGRSQGYPDMLSIATDGEYILKYIKENKDYEKIGVHGQSLGGSVAARLGKSIDFMFADRTFSSLGNVAFYSYGVIVYCAFKALGPQESDPVKDYLASSCYKVISCDCEDAMIPNLASLKAGVSFTLQTQKYIRESESLIRKYSQNEHFNVLVGCLRQAVKKNTVKDEESPEVDVIGALCNLEVLGRSLYKVGKRKEIEQELILWLITVSTWPDCSKIVTTVMGEIKNSLIEFQETEEALQLKSIYTCLKHLLEEDLGISNENSFQPGHILPLTCGHNSVYSPYELYHYKQHLKSASFLPKSYS